MLTIFATDVLYAFHFVEKIGGKRLFMSLDLVSWDAFGQAFSFGMGLGNNGENES